MIKSVTGFGRYENVTNDYKVTVEIKSVNHRYLDVNIKLLNKFGMFESRIRNLLKEYAGRGKIDIYINYEDYSDHGVSVRYHPEIAKGYVQAMVQAKDAFSIPSGLDAVSLVRFPDVISIEEDLEDMESVYPVIEQAVREAGKHFVLSREQEGQNLKEDILSKLEYLEQTVAFVDERSPEMLKEYRQKIQTKVEELLQDRKVDDAVLATELIVYADKVCVDEETVRLRSHIKNMKDTLEKEEPIGRKLDFISQEMNREANTILSKANDKELSQKAIDLKTEIEKIREQIQNIE